MSAPDFTTAAQAALNQQQAAVEKLLRQFLATYPAADHFLFEYLLGLDHAIVAYALRADESVLGSATLFKGFEAYQTTLAAHDQQHSTRQLHDFRGDLVVADLVS